MTTTSETVSIELTKSQAIVLFEWLSKHDEADDVKYDYDAEQRIVWRIQAILEKTLTEPFKDNYTQILEQARNEVMTE